MLDVKGAMDCNLDSTFACPFDCIYTHGIAYRHCVPKLSTSTWKFRELVRAQIFDSAAWSLATARPAPYFQGYGIQICPGIRSRAIPGLREAISHNAIGPDCVVPGELKNYASWLDVFD